MLLIIGIWIVCGIISYGAIFAYMQSVWPTIADEIKSEDMKLSLVLAMTGPIGLLVAIFMTKGFKYGFKWK